MHFTLDQVQTCVMNIPTVKERVLKPHNDENIMQLSIQFDPIGKTTIMVILLIIKVFQPLTMNTTILSSSIRNLTIIEETMNTTMRWLLNITITNLPARVHVIMNITLIDLTLNTIVNVIIDSTQFV